MRNEKNQNIRGALLGNQILIQRARDVNKDIYACFIDVASKSDIKNFLYKTERSF